MLARIWASLQARRRAMLEAEALVYRFGSRGGEMAQTLRPRRHDLRGPSRPLPAGTGSFLQAIIMAHPHLEAPATAEMARRILAAEASIIEVIASDFVRDPIPNGYDAVILSNVVHLFCPTNNAALLGRIYASVEPGAGLLLVDFWTDDAHLQPAFAASGEFKIVSGEGDVYSVDGVTGWLRSTGWDFTAPGRCEPCHRNSR